MAHHGTSQACAVQASHRVFPAARGARLPIIGVRDRPVFLIPHPEPYPPSLTLKKMTLKIRHIHRQARTHIHTHLRTRAPLGVVEGLFRPSKRPGVLGGAEGGLYSRRRGVGAVVQPVPAKAGVVAVEKCTIKIQKGTVHRSAERLYACRAQPAQWVVHRWFAAAILS